MREGRRFCLAAGDAAIGIKLAMAKTLNIDGSNRVMTGLIGDLVSDKSLFVLCGVVLSQRKNRDEVYRKVRKSKPAHSAILFFGHLPLRSAATRVDSMLRLRAYSVLLHSRSATETRAIGTRNVPATMPGALWRRCKEIDSLSRKWCFLIGLLGFASSASHGRGERRSDHPR